MRRGRGCFGFGFRRRLSANAGELPTLEEEKALLETRLKAVEQRLTEAKK